MWRLAGLSVVLSADCSYLSIIGEAEFQSILGSS